MLRALALAMLLLDAGAAAPPAAAPAPPQYAQLIVREQIVVRVSPAVRDAPDAPAAVQWKEKKGPKCVQARQVIAATVVDQNSVDLILRDRTRLRAKLESSCPALDYYHGFYVSPSPDGLICADRDVIRSRMGGACGIDKFKTLRLSRRD
ncbi:MAG: hypothetical protein JO276_13690 [Sphingomonadaceae bacterium]|nr:hypothetical protein [Sphingomonadaceae bacterium]